MHYLVWSLRRLLLSLLLPLTAIDHTFDDNADCGGDDDDDDDGSYHHNDHDDNLETRKLPSAVSTHMPRFSWDAETAPGVLTEGTRKLPVAV